VNITLSELAVTELKEISNFYVSSGGTKLGIAFASEFQVTATLVAQNPLIGRKLKSGTRWFALRRFPYKLIYLASAAEILVIAVAHERRKPNYWRKSTA
jgi:toxin ParE1/3/4